nr:histidine phosphatase family protein [Fimbriimonadaceae bacterium]
MKLFLVRHGQTVWNSESRAQGHSDIPLDSVGVQQARMLASSLAEQGIRRILTSDLNRAYSTSLPVSESLGIEITK